MAITIANLTTLVNTFIRDDTTDSVSAAERRAAMDEATVWLLENTTNDHLIETYNLDYIPTVHHYRIDSTLADFLEPADLRRGEKDQEMPATHKSSREMAEDIGVASSEFAFGIERKDSTAYAVINLSGKYTAQKVATFDSLTADGGTWLSDGTDSDAENEAAETVEMTEGVGSVKFDVDVSNSANNRATLSSTITSMDFTDWDDIGSLTLDVYIPDATYSSSVTLYWGNSSTVYFSLAKTTDAQGNTIADGWNTFKFDWPDATETGTVDVTLIDYIRVDVNYTASQADDTGYRIDNLQIAKPERLVFYYLGMSLGWTAAATLTKIYRYTAETNVPFYSSAYEHYMYAVSHKAAAIIFRAMGLIKDAEVEDNEAEKALKPKQKIFPSSLTKEDRNFKVKNNNFNKRKF